MEEERKAYFSYTLDSYDSDTRLFKLNIYLTIRYGDEDNGIFMEVKATRAISKDEITKTINKVKAKLLDVAEKLLTDIIYIASTLESLGEASIHKASIRNYISSIAEEEDVAIAHNIVPGLYDEDIYVEPRELRERAERLLRLLQELKRREAF